MPKIEVQEQALYRYAGKKIAGDAELEEILVCAKAELDGRDEETGALKIELNDTNRPDLWSTAGLGRQLRLYLGGKSPEYSFFSRQGDEQEAGKRLVLVDSALRETRPYIAAFEVTGKPIDEDTLNDLIQTQEKLCWNYGRKRKSIAMGVYRAQLIEYPVHYRAADPDATRFVPLGMSRELSLREIIKEHPKGQEFGPIVADFPRMPFLADSADEVLSFPPVINSARIGAVEVGDSSLFIELTGTDLPSLVLSASIVACDLSDAGFTILPVKIQYPYDTPFGRSMVTPYYFQEPVTLETSFANRMLGEELSTVEITSAVQRMGCRAKISGEKLTVTPPEYRNDFLHPVDVAEDIMIGRGMNTFSPALLTDFTVGRLTPIETFARKVKGTLVGLGYQEMMFNYLSSAHDLIERIYPEDETVRLNQKHVREKVVVQIANPMSEGYEFVRNSILPNLLGAEAASASAPYPHSIFEIGKVAVLDDADNSGTRTINSLGLLSADASAGFNTLSAQIAALFYFLYREFSLSETDDPRFIPGRAAQISCSGRDVGVFGELHPELLERWGIQMPATAAELDLDRVLG
ncbi:phenylalanine--tRNA ligase subunit beta [Salinispira pacifica]